MKKLLLVAAFELSVLVAFGGDLEWSTTRIRLSAREGKGFVEAYFPFRNASSRIVTIKRAEPSCTCTTAHVSAPQIAPGGSGEIKAVFNLEGRAGPQIKTITVTTDEVETTPVVLRLDVNIRPIVRIEPQRIEWKLHEPGEPRYADIYFAPKEKVAILGIEIGEPNFTATLVPTSDPVHRRLRVAPKNTEIRTQSQIVIVVRVFGATRLYAVKVRVGNTPSDDKTTKHL